jgi:hypothetical protein
MKRCRKCREQPEFFQALSTLESDSLHPTTVLADAMTAEAWEDDAAL